MYNEAVLQDTLVTETSVIPWPVTRAEPRHEPQPVVVLPGDGVGPEVMNACLKILKAVAPGLDWIMAEARTGTSSPATGYGLSTDTYDAIARTGVVLKGPMTPPAEYGTVRSDTMLRNALGLYAQVRPICQLPYPGLPYAYSDIDVVVVRDLCDGGAGGAEYMHTPDVAQRVNTITRGTSERIARLAFALAEANGHDTVHCATRADGPSLAEGLYRSVFEEVGQDHHEIALKHLRLEDAANELLAFPHKYHVIALSPLHGDPVGDIATSLTGGFGRCASAELGAHTALFQPLHGPLPELAGQNAANPTAMVLAGAMMLRHLGLLQAAETVEWAVRQVYQEGSALTDDVSLPGFAVGTDAFAEAVIESIELAAPASTGPDRAKFVAPTVKRATGQRTKRRFDGLDVFVEWRGAARDLVERLEPLGDRNAFQLYMISNRGGQSHNETAADLDTSDLWLCRFGYHGKRTDAEKHASALLGRLSAAVRWTHVERLTSFNGTPGYAQVDPRR